MHIDRQNLLVGLQRKIGIKFRNVLLLNRALTHRSFLNENLFAGQHNELLEFLGDAVLDFLVTEFLVKRFPDRTEGALTAWKAALVNNKNLFRVSQILELDDIILTSRGEARSKGTKNFERIAADAVESLIGAIYLDRGLGACRLFVDHHFLADMPEALNNFEEVKSKFQEMTRSFFKLMPCYTVVKESGPDHERHFKVAVCLGEKPVGIGNGRSRKEAEENAVRRALARKEEWWNLFPTDKQPAPAEQKEE